MNFLRGISIVLLLFAYNANAKEETYKICDLTQGRYQYDVSLERCQGLKQFDVLAKLSSKDAALYCHAKFPIIIQEYSITCKYNGATIRQKKDITVRAEVSNN